MHGVCFLFDSLCFDKVVKMFPVAITQNMKNILLNRLCYRVKTNQK